jgi:hypothetical protein
MRLEYDDLGYEIATAIAWLRNDKPNSGSRVTARDDTGEWEKRRRDTPPPLILDS